MANNPNAKENLKPFKKGFDVRRNLKGIPKSAVEARKHLFKIAAEILESDKGDMTRFDAMLRLKFGSRAPKDFETILKGMYPGLLTDNIDLTNSDGSLKPPSVIEIIKHVEKDSDETA